MWEEYGKMSEQLISGDIEGIQKATREALDAGVAARDVLEKGLLAGMEVVGQRFKACEMFIPEVLRSAKTMHSAMEILRPLLSESDIAGTGTVVIPAPLEVDGIMRQVPEGKLITINQIREILAKRHNASFG